MTPPNDFPEQIKPDSIIIPERLRKAYGDIDGLAESIARLGLIQPIVLNRESDGSYSLLAGGRRLTAILALGWEWLEHGKGFVYKTELSPAARLELELEENVQRLDMTWQERAVSIRQIHSLKCQVSAEEGDEWGHDETGKLLNMARSHVSNILRVAREIELGNTEVIAASGVREALTTILKQKENEGLAYLAKQNLAQQYLPVKDAATSPTQRAEGETPAEYEERIERLGDEGDEQREANELSPEETIHPVESIQISNRFLNTDCLKFLRSIPDDGLDAHTLSDPPFAIDMDNIQQAGGGMNIESVRETHDVDKNKSLLCDFIEELFRATKPGKYAVLFCDPQHWEWLRSFAEKVGWKTQRWPLVWTKLHQCQNMSAQYNFTKATEFALVLRKGDAMLAQAAPRNWMDASNIIVKRLLPDHPFVKPFDLWQWIAFKIALAGETIYEPFMGRGSMPLALLDVGYRVIGTEIDEQHYNSAIVSICEFYRRRNPNVIFS